MTHTCSSWLDMVGIFLMVFRSPSHSFFMVDIVGIYLMMYVNVVIIDNKIHP
ncbi:hypothetical protein Syun_021637 [Stephania yunnanensis]|uniref:Uncharacterized protein n=1 Tax=Stephania yunnanensis TaxID=152371 RepID=A0AAP0IGR7_9MAGN